MGVELARALRDRMGLSEDAAGRRRVGRIAERLADRVPRPGRRFDVLVVRAEEVNAFALPGGFVFVNEPLVRASGSDDALAFVIGHEMAHVLHEDALQRVVGDATLSTAIRALGARGAVGSALGSAAARLLQSAYSRDREIEADAKGLRIARAAGFRAEGALEFLALLSGQSAGGEGLGTYLASHPDPSRRVELLRRRAGLGPGFPPSQTLEEGT
jgi:predicted Zn-dependent protease